MVGDSLSAGFGLRQNEGWVPLLKIRIREQGYNYKVINASISGDTTDSGAIRINRILSAHTPDIVIIELGANDGLRGLSLKSMYKNLEKMIQQSQQSGARVLLIGMAIPPNYGLFFTKQFSSSFHALSRSLNVPLVPLLIAGIENDRSFFLDDQLHPNAQAQPILLENVWKKLLPLLEK